MLGCPFRARRPGRTLVPLLLLVAVLLLDASQPTHLHADETPGFYNETHVLVALAAFGHDTALAGGTEPSWILPVAGAALAPAEPGDPALQHPDTASRAPPLA